MNNYNYPFPQNGNNNQNTWQNNGQNWNNLQDNGMYGFQRQPMNYQQMRSMMNQNMINQNMPQTTSKIDRVNGREGAEAYFLMPNSEVLLLDTTNPIVWLKQTDSAGYGTVTGFNVVPLKENADMSQNDYSELERRITEIEQLLDGMTYEQPESKQQNVQPPTTANVQQPNTGNFKPKHNPK